MAGLGITRAPGPRRDSLRARLRRVWVNAPLILQTATAASVSWFIAERLLGHTTPFFAPIAAVIVLGNSMGQRIQRAIELMVGVAVGILVGDLLIMALGNGPLQLALVIMLAVVVAVFLGTGVLLANQAAASAVLIATLYPPSGGVYYTRWIDALIGGAVAFIVFSILMPIMDMNPV